MLPHESDDNPYLQQEVFTASPLQLRLMLIQRAETLCGFVQQLWAAGEELQAAGWLLRVREILGELLDGVKDKGNPLSQPISDFYVFLLQLLTRIEQTRDSEKLKTLEELLHIENETWQQVVQKSLRESAANSSPFPSSPFPTADLSANGLTASEGLSLEF